MENVKSTQSQLGAVEGLLREWDPIGARTKKPSAAGKYDAYAPLVLKKLQARSAVDVLTDFLTHLTVSEMGVAPNIEHDRKTAERLLAWWESHR